jgi:hypothetical protein
MKRTAKLFFFSFLATLSLAFGVLSLRSYQVVERVTGVKLVGGCELYFFSPPAKPEKTLALACPRVDLIRLWPLPVTTTWFEDWWEDNRPKGVYGVILNGTVG